MSILTSPVLTGPALTGAQLPWAKEKALCARIWATSNHGHLTVEGLGSKGTPEGLGDFRGKMGSASLPVPCSTRPLSPPSSPPSISLSLFLSPWELASPGLWEVMNISSPFSSGSRPGWQLPQQVGEKENRKGWAGVGG